MTFDGAAIKEQGVIFGLMVVKPHVLPIRQGETTWSSKPPLSTGSAGTEGRLSSGRGACPDARPTKAQRQHLVDVYVRLVMGGLRALAEER